MLSPASRASPGVVSIDQQLLQTGARLGKLLRPAVHAADLDRRVSARNLHLCAALGALAVETAKALGASAEDADRAGHAAAMLSLVTKVDDQIIDSPDFHGGMQTDRAALRDRCTRFLAPTLTSIRTGRPATDEPRCQLAAQLGCALRDLGSHGDRLSVLLDEIAHGWGVQVDAVAVFSAHPSTVDLETVAGVTAQISGSWLRMISLVGTLAPGALRGFTVDEHRAFTEWGRAIQQADALADLGKDIADGLVSSLPAWLLHDVGPGAWEAGLACPEIAVAAHNIDVRCVVSAAELGGLRARLSGLGKVPALLHWIHGFLLFRYLQGPACVRPMDHPAMAPHMGSVGSWAAYLGAAGQGS